MWDVRVPHAEVAQRLQSFIAWHEHCSQLRRNLADIGFNDLPRPPLPLYHPVIKTARFLSALFRVADLDLLLCVSSAAPVEKEQKALAAKAAETPPLFEWVNPGPIAKPVVQSDIGEQKARISGDGTEVA